jgi:lysophospholipase L1-like esterase
MGVVYVSDGPDGDASATGSPPATYQGTVVEALKAEPWWPEWNKAYGELFQRGTMSQYAGTEFADVRDRYLTWVAGVRRSWQPDSTACRPTVDVWMLGGSALFGAGQRDDYTIPSELARIAWKHGYRLRIQNRAIPGDVSWIEQRRLELALTAGAKAPQLVVFYDGFNDVRAVEGAFRTGAPFKNRFLALSDRDLVPLLNRLTRETRDGHEVVVANTIDINAHEVDTPEEVAAVADAAAFQYRGTDELSRRFLADRHIPVARFFQPSVNTRDPQVHGDFPPDPAARTLMEAMRRRLPRGTTDLADVFDGDRTPYYADDVHTNEAANIKVSAAMWKKLQRTVKKIARPGGDSCS